MKRWSKALSAFLAGNSLPLLRLLAPYAAALTFAGLIVGAAGVYVTTFTPPPPPPGQAQACQLADTTTSTLSTSVPAVYRKIFLDAAAARGADANIVTTIFYVENGRHFPEPPAPYGHGKQWPVSGRAAAGPFQFIPGTLREFGVDGNGDHVVDVNDLKDAAASAANYIAQLGGKAGIPVGYVLTPKVKPSVVNVFASYNAGPAGKFGNPETQAYIKFGTTFYQKLVSASLNAGTQVQQVSVCVPTTNAKIMPQAVLIGAGLSQQLSNIGLDQSLVKQQVRLRVDGQSLRSLADIEADVDRSASALRPAKAVLLESGGTAPSGTDFLATFKRITAKVKAQSPAATVYWINSTRLHSHSGARNLALQKLAESGQIKLVNWFNLVHPGVSPYGEPPSSDAHNWMTIDPARDLPSDTGTRALSGLIIQTLARDVALHTAAGDPSSEAVAASGWVSPIAKADDRGLIQCWNTPGIFGFGHHAGIDILASFVPAYAAHDGVVARIGTDPAAGNFLIVRITDNLYYVYEHMSVIDVVVNQPLKARDKVGTTGNNGRSTVPHLHFGVAVAETLGSYGDTTKTRNPLDYLPRDRSFAPCG